MLFKFAESMGETERSYGMQSNVSGSGSPGLRPVPGLGSPGPGPWVRVRPVPRAHELIIKTNMDPYPPIWIHIGNINLYEFNMFYINSITTASLENLNMFYLFETFKCPYKHIPCVKSTMLPYDAADSYIPILHMITCF